MPAQTHAGRTPITPLRLEPYYLDLLEQLVIRLSTPGKHKLSKADVVRLALERLAGTGKKLGKKS